MSRVRDFCLRVLMRGDLASKLAPPPRGRDEGPAGPAIAVDRPARLRALALRGGVGPLPGPRALAEPAARATCLARFAHHELMAAELFAWALVRWPDLPVGLRSAWLGILTDEQRHCRLYLDRLAAHGSRLEDHALSGYFWLQASAIASSPHGPRAFLAAMGLTLEQANLDFSHRYARAFRDAGDEASARVCEAVHRDEIRHVRLAARWLAELCGPAADGKPRDPVDCYESAVPFPLSAARAKGRPFQESARREAGLDPAFIAHVRNAAKR